MKKDYENIPDEELIVRLRDGEEHIIDFIMEKYKDLVKNKGRSMHILGADAEDLIQEGMIGLLRLSEIMTVDGMPVFLHLQIYVFPDKCIQLFKRQIEKNMLL